MVHTAPKTTSQFNAYLSQKSTSMIMDDGNRKVLQRPQFIEQWVLREDFKWHLAGIS